MGEGLSLEAQDAAMREGFASHHTGIIDEKLDGEIVGGINDEVIVADDVQCVGRIEKLSIGLHLHIGIDGLNLLLGALYLGHTQIFGEMDIYYTLRLKRVDFDED